MKTKWHFYVLWSVVSLGLLSCLVDTYESPFTRRKKIFKLDTPKSKPIKQSTSADRKSSLGSPASRSPLSLLRPPPPTAPRPMRPRGPRAKVRSGFAYPQDVSVTCSTSDFVVRVKPAFYGQGADAEELQLGSTCRSNGVLRPYGDILFTYPLTACDAVRQLPHGYLVYRYVLHYEPSPKRFPKRAQRIDVDIECRYQRNRHVHQLTVKPTWETTVVRKRLKGSLNYFQIDLMDDSWSRPVKSQVYQLGKTVHFQVSTPHLPTEGKLYINSCYATPSSGSKSSLKYTFIDNFGCMLDSKRDPGASQFISHTDKTIRFSLKAFQFTSDPDSEVNIFCKLFVTSEGPSPAHKSCTYRGNRWKALTGNDSICECCDSQCVTSKPRRAMMEGSASSTSLLVSDQLFTAEEGFLPVNMSREGEATIHHYIDDLHSHENMWKSVDVVKYDDEEEQGSIDEEDKEVAEQLDGGESGVILGVMAEPYLDQLGFRKRVLVEKKEERDSNQAEEDGSGYVVQEDYSESEQDEGFVEGEDEISDLQQMTHVNQKEGKVLVQLEQMLPSKVGQQRESQPLVSEGEEENWKHIGGGEEGENVIASEVEWKNADDDLLDDRKITWYFEWR